MNIFIFSFKIIMVRPHIIIIFSSNNWGLLEKSIMGLLGKIFGSSIVICPRASEQLINNKFIKSIVKFIFKYFDCFICGERVSNTLKMDYNVNNSKIKIIRTGRQLIITSQLVKKDSK